AVHGPEADFPQHSELDHADNDGISPNFRNNSTNSRSGDARRTACSRTGSILPPRVAPTPTEEMTHVVTRTPRVPHCAAGRSPGGRVQPGLDRDGAWRLGCNGRSGLQCWRSLECPADGR